MDTGMGQTIHEHQHIPHLCCQTSLVPSAAWWLEICLTCADTINDMFQQGLWTVWLSIRCTPTNIGRHQAAAGKIWQVASLLTTMSRAQITPWYSCRYCCYRFASHSDKCNRLRNGWVCMRLHIQNPSTIEWSRQNCNFTCWFHRSSSIRYFASLHTLSKSVTLSSLGGAADFHWP